MPRRFRRRAPRRRRGGFGRKVMGAVRFGARTFAGPVIASLAKRFISVLGTPGAPTTFSLASRNKQIISQIPRNITGTDVQQENRVGRKIFIKGVTLFTTTQASATWTGGMARIVLIRQMDPAENADINDIFAPLGSTKGMKVLYDKTHFLQAQAATNGSSAHVTKKYITVNAMQLYDGNVNDGTDADEGTLVLYHYGSAGTGAANLVGSATIHYRETV